VGFAGLAQPRLPEIEDRHLQVGLTAAASTVGGRVGSRRGPGFE
jgi:hypothetical protein